MDLTTIVLAVAGVSGIYLAWNIGANDLANLMGTSIGSRALGLRRALVVAAVCEVAGALLAGPTVSETIASDLVVVDALPDTPFTVALGLAGALLAAALWLAFATARGWPVSTTHSIVGAIIGFGVAAGGLDGIDFGAVGLVATAWVAAPVASAAIAYVLFVVLRRNVLVAERPLVAVRSWAPVMVAPIFALATIAALYRSPLPLVAALDWQELAAVALGVGALGAGMSVPLLARATRGAESARHDEALRRTERVFLALQLPSACFVAFAHGSNDVGNTVGPLSAVFAAVVGSTEHPVPIHPNVILIAAVGMVVGLATYGFRVMGTVRDQMSSLSASRGFTAEVSAGTVILVASKLGMPISTTHTLVAAVIGVGLARSLGAIDSLVMRRILTGWLVTVPVCATMSAAIFLIAHALLP